MHVSQVEYRILPDRIMAYEAYVPECLRGQGLGQKILDHLIDLSETTGLPIRLSVGSEDEGCDQARLIDWYSRHGFIHDPSVDMEYQMERRP